MFRATADYVTAHEGHRRQMLFDVRADDLQTAERLARGIVKRRTKDRARKVSIALVPAATPNGE